MGGEDNGANSEELARRIEALERENQELREALGRGASHRESERPQQQPQAREVTDASSKTVRGLLLGPRDEQAYSRPLAGISCPLTWWDGCLRALLGLMELSLRSWLLWSPTALAPNGWGSAQ
jgi:hypothetical protein